MRIINEIKHMDRIWKIFLASILVLILLSLSQVLIFKYVDPPGTVNMVWERMISPIMGTEYIPSKYS
ncbi:MAG: hypothetical protein KJ658_03095, partial [Proteobacteria bacterium]|nr:hypothetical protein [Pseudomonadota bacterium]